MNDRSSRRIGLPAHLYAFRQLRTVRRQPLVWISLAAKLREVFALESAGPTYEGRELVQQIQSQLTRLACGGSFAGGTFDAPTIQGLRRASLLTDDRYLWHRPTMVALRALKKIDAREGCQSLKIAAAPRCLRVNNEDFCQ